MKKKMTIILKPKVKTDRQVLPSKAILAKLSKAWKQVGKKVC